MNITKHFKYLLYITLTIFISNCSPAKKDTRTQPLQPTPIVIKNISIIPMTTDNTVIKNATVVIKGEKIISINKDIPKNATLIDGTGKWLIPGLIDMHVHNLADGPNTGTPTEGPFLKLPTQNFMSLYIANGVTTAFELSARSEHIAQRNEILKGTVIGPRIALAALIDAGGRSNISADTPEEGRAAVRFAKGQGYEFIKMYSNLKEEVFTAIIEEAKKQHLKVVGHIPNIFKGKTAQAFIPHFGLVAHAEEFSNQTDTFTEEEAERMAMMAKKNNTWVIPNLSNLVYIAKQARSLDSVRSLASFKYVHPLMQSKWIVSNQYNKGTNPARVAFYDELVAFHVKLVKAFKKVGVPMVAGTDAGTSGIVWGFSLHDELDLLVNAGLSPEEALISATRLPANWLQIEEKVGTVEAGKYADLILLDNNPLENIKNTRSISGVFVNGQWIDKAKINSLLSDVAQWNNAHKDQYNWIEFKKNLRR